jgi:hypothetical protein
VADINAMIAQGAQPVRLESPINMMAQMSQLQAAQGANQLRQMQMEQAMRQQEQENALAAMPYETLRSTPQEALRYGAPGRAMYGELLKGAKERREAELASARTAGENIKLSKAALAGVNSQEAYDAWRQYTTGLLPGLAQILPAEFSNENIRRLSLEADKLYENVIKEINQGPITQVTAFPKYGYGVGKTMGVYAVEPTALQRAQTEEAIARTAEVGVPASIRELRAFQNLSLEDQNTFLKLQEGKGTKVIVGGEKLTPLQEAADKKFSDDYVAWKAGGGTTATKNIAQIKSVMDKLHNKEPLTGPMTGIMPDVVLAFTNPNSLDARQRVEQVAQESLRTILGAQFTQKEGENFIARVYDPKLSPEKNASRLRAMFMQLETAANQKQAMVNYADKHGTLRGYTGTQPSINDFYEAIQERPPKRTGQPATSKRNEVDTNNPLLK